MEIQYETNGFRKKLKSDIWTTNAESWRKTPSLSRHAKDWWQSVVQTTEEEQRDNPARLNAYIITEINGSQITTRNDCKQITRHTTRMLRVHVWERNWLATTYGKQWKRRRKRRRQARRDQDRQWNHSLHGEEEEAEREVTLACENRC